MKTINICLKMKEAAREFRLHAQVNECLHPMYGANNNDELIEDFFFAGAVWYREYIKDKVKTRTGTKE